MNILTFDIEEWFHILDNESTKGEKQWGNFECRIHKNTDRILNILEQTETKATFFCMGWIAKKYPEVIRKIAEKYEIGSHTMMHQLVYEQGESKFRKDVAESIDILQCITGKKVKYFRAPGFSIRESEKWAFEILIDNGIEGDSSVFPTSRAHGGFPSYPTPTPSIIAYKGRQLKEFPINYTKIMGKEIVFGGGGYFRLFPYFLIKKWTLQNNYNICYLHPRDFDVEQPIIPDLSQFRKFKAYVGLEGAENKFEKWLNDFNFIDITSASEKIDWEKTPVVKL